MHLAGDKEEVSPHYLAILPLKPHFRNLIPSRPRCLHALNGLSSIHKSPPWSVPFSSCRIHSREGFWSDPRSPNKHHSAMEGLKLIAQSTFDRHQKFSGNDDSRRYNVIEIGAFESPNTPTLTTGAASNRQSIGSTPNSHSASDGNAGTGKPQDDATKSAGANASEAGGNRTTFNEWAVHEEDLVAFMKMKPVESVPTSPKKQASQLQQEKIPKAQGQATDSGTASTTGHSRSVSLQSTKTASTLATTATAATSPAKMSDEPPRKARQEVEAAASLKMVCIQRAAIVDEDADADANALAISREAFLHLYVDTMDADHGALYFIARDYDGFHEYNDTTKGVVTTYIGTADYALVWTFNRRSLETKGLLIDRKPPEQPKDPGPTPESTSAKKKSSKAAAVVPSEAWIGFRNMLKMYRGYIFAPPLLSFVACLHMLHSFDDQLSANDLPHVKDIERKVGNGATETTRAGEVARTDRSKSQSLSRQSSSYARRPSTEPSFLNFSPGTPSQQQKPFSIDRLITWSQASGEIADSAARKLRQIKMGREILEMISREHETVVADVVAPSFLDRYHRAMQGMIEAIPAVERHMASLEETLVDLKARTERLNGLVCALHCLSAYNPLQGGLKLTASAY